MINCLCLLFGGFIHSSMDESWMDGWMLLLHVSSLVSTQQSFIKRSCTVTQCSPGESDLITKHTIHGTFSV